MLLLALTFFVLRTIISSPLNKALIRLSSLVSVLHLCTSACRPSPSPPCPLPAGPGPHVRHPVALVCLSVPQSVSLTWLHSSCASMTTWDERDCGGLISIHNEFFSPKSGFESRRWWSTARAAVIVSESWHNPRARLTCHKTANRERKEMGRREREWGGGEEAARGLVENKEAVELLAGNY